MCVVVGGVVYCMAWDMYVRVCNGYMCLCDEWAEPGGVCGSSIYVLYVCGMCEVCGLVCVHRLFVVVMVGECVCVRGVGLGSTEGFVKEVVS